MAGYTLGEVFGYPAEDQRPDANRARAERLCRFSGDGVKCTKVSVEDPLGVCSIVSDGVAVCICPTRFREGTHVEDRASKFFFPPGSVPVVLPEIRLKDAAGKAAGNIDIVLATHENGKVTDFGSIEIQAVYISGNIRRPFARYMKTGSATNPAVKGGSAERSGFHPDFLSSSRKRLMPQLKTKGSILNHWGKKQVVVLDTAFFATLPILEQVSEKDSDLMWLVYEFRFDRTRGTYVQTLSEVVHSRFEDALVALTGSTAGPIDDFTKVLESRIARHWM